MTRAERATEAAELKAMGLNGIQIAERMGLSRSYAYELLNDPDGEGVAARKRRYEQPCVDCGESLSGSAGNGPNAPERCRRCARAETSRVQRVERRRAIIAAIQRYTEQYGEPPVTASFGSQQGDGWSDVRYAELLRRCREGGWPHYDTVLREFGTFHAALEAAGVIPSERARKVAAGVHRRLAA